MKNNVKDVRCEERERERKRDGEEEIKWKEVDILRDKTGKGKYGSVKKKKNDNIKREKKKDVSCSNKSRQFGSHRQGS